MDDGALYGELTALGQAYAFLRDELARVNLRFNEQKCELYMEEVLPVPEELASIPVITDKALMTYLGAPLQAGASRAVSTAVERAETATNAISKLAAQYPRQALSLLRTTVGACRVQYLCQAMHPDEWPNDALQSVDSSLKRAFEILLGAPSSGTVWAQATLPITKGGLGLRFN